MELGFIVSVWVPSKNWKDIKTLDTWEQAYIFATELEPLEVKVTRLSDQRTWLGKHYVTGTRKMELPDILDLANMVKDNA